MDRYVARHVPLTTYPTRFYNWSMGHWFLFCFTLGSRPLTEKRKIPETYQLPPGIVFRTIVVAAWMLQGPLFAESTRRGGIQATNKLLNTSIVQRKHHLLESWEMSAVSSAVATSFPESFGNNDNSGEEEMAITWNKTSENPQDHLTNKALRSTAAAMFDSVATVPPEKERNSTQSLVLLIASLANLGISFNVVRFSSTLFGGIRVFYPWRDSFLPSSRHSDPESSSKERAIHILLKYNVREDKLLRRGKCHRFCVYVWCVCVVGQTEEAGPPPPITEHGSLWFNPGLWSKYCFISKPQTIYSTRNSYVLVD